MDAIYFGYRDETVIVVVEQEPMYPAGRLCEIIAWPFGPILLTVVVNPAVRQVCCARFSLIPTKFGTTH
jgi:hypothetical protein